MNKFEIYEADFIKGVKKSDLRDTVNTFIEAKNIAYNLVKSFCQDEKPQLKIIPKFQHNHKKRIWAFTTNCDFGSLIREI